MAYSVTAAARYMNDGLQDEALSKQIKEQVHATETPADQSYRNQCGQHHAVVVPYPAQGHLNPVMQLARQLASRGFHVTFVITSEFHSRIADNSAAVAAVPTDKININFAKISDGLPPEMDRFGGNLEPLSRAFVAMAGRFEDLIRDLMQQEPRVTCIFSDMFALFTQDVANMFGIPRVAVWLQSAASFTVNLHAPLLISKGHMPVINSKSDDLITCIPDHPPLAIWELPTFYQVPDLSDFMVQFKIKPFLRLKEAAFVLINTYYDLESRILDSLNKELQKEGEEHPPVLAAGPFLPPAYINEADSSSGGDTTTGTDLWKQDNECLRWLDQQAPASVLYISFGSIVHMESTQFWELAAGLDEACRSSKSLRLLWVIRPDFLRAVQSGPGAIDMPGGLSEREKDGVIYRTSWAPQAMVLAHEAVGAFLTHCGWNSTVEAVSMGVPMLGWPLFAEQWLNRKWVVEEWGIGLKFESDQHGIVRSHEVGRVIMEMMMEGAQAAQMRQRALRFKEARRLAWTPQGSSFTNLTKVIDRLSSESPRKCNTKDDGPKDA